VTTEVKRMVRPKLYRNSDVEKIPMLQQVFLIEFSSCHSFVFAFCLVAQAQLAVR
jgi:hypothetical protein